MLLAFFTSRACATPLLLFRLKEMTLRREFLVRDSLTAETVEPLLKEVACGALDCEWRHREQSLLRHY